jgi:hypothetical protein
VIRNKITHFDNSDNKKMEFWTILVKESNEEPLVFLNLQISRKNIKEDFFTFRVGAQLPNVTAALIHFLNPFPTFKSVGKGSIFAICEEIGKIFN